MLCSSCKCSQNRSCKKNEVVFAVREKHIQILPAFCSHYSRSHNPVRKILTLIWVYEKCSNLYVGENKKKKKINTLHVHKCIHKKTCNEEFSLYFHQPCKDTCQKYAMLNQKIKLSSNTKQRRDLKQQHDIHLKMLN